MNSPTYITLAAARLASPEQFDSAIRGAVVEAARVVGKETVVRALCAPMFSSAREEKKAA